MEETLNQETVQEFEDIEKVEIEEAIQELAETKGCFGCWTEQD